MPKLAINGGRPVREAAYPQWPFWDANELKAVQEVIKSGVWGINGSRVRQLEEKFGRFCGCDQAIAMSSGTLALRAALVAAGLPAGCEVIVPAYTFVATATAVLESNMVPVFADIDPDTGNISVESAAELITENTRAILPVHLAGTVADMDSLNALAARHSLVVIEDACQAWGSEHNGRKAGSIGAAGTFSFQSSKHITGGEGGAVTTNDPDLAEKCRSFINCGRVRGGLWHEHGLLGGNYRLSELQAAVILTQFERYEPMLAQRQAAAAFLRRELAGIEGITPLQLPPYATASSCHFLILRYDQAAWGGLSREQFIKALNAEGVRPAHCGYFTPIYRQRFMLEKNVGPFDRIKSHVFRGEVIDYGKFHCPVTERFTGGEALWLLQNLLLADQAGLEEIVAALRKLRENYSELL
ncbi:DegT/DnrJ/EryC1/StrS family aminotransferase [bacterium]|nr:DegT/DnrJ/EryC1/StrS family aminotransferase [bacterium]